jgi:thioester reductase-like protein
MACTLLTGATGFLGANLLHDLVTRTSSDVCCLVRAASADEARARVRGALTAQGLWREMFETRVQFVAGDLASPRLGRSDAENTELAGRVDTIVHAAARVNLALPYRSLRPANVLGTQELLRFAACGGPRPFVFVSSIAALRGSARRRSRASGYAVTKWVGERLVRRAMTRGVPAAIYRPGRMSAHAGTGAYNPHDLFALLVAASVRLRKAPGFDAFVHLTSVDVVSRTIVDRVAGGVSSGPRLCHLVNPAVVYWADVVRMLADQDAIDLCIPYAQWRPQLHRAAAGDGDRHLKMLDLVLSPTRPPLPKEDLDLADEARYGDSRELLDRYVRTIVRDVSR